ncbi:MAG: MerR family transcriptional regulator [Actinomycetota bacterium]
MFKIGDFSRLSMVAVSALRYYADLGLLEPAAGGMPEQEVVVKSVPDVRGLGMREKVAGSAGIGELIGDGFAGLGMAGAMIAGVPVAVSHDPEFFPESIDVERVYPVPSGVKGPVSTPAGRILEPRLVPGGEVAVIVHVGPYEAVGESYQALADWIGQHGYRVSGPCRELYLSSPMEPGQAVTEIRMPVEKG